MSNDITTGLQRKLSPGTAFNKLFEKTSCKVTPLGEGDTFHSIDIIKEYSLKYQYQSKDVANALVKKTLPQTVNSFYRFCYDHFQYKADGFSQNIKSPACAWHSRKEGMDCKSFSVLASTLLSNAGIKHYITKIKQPFFYPEEFTHVYVRVPIDQTNADLKKGYYIIDATTHDNKEAVMIDENNTFMEAMPHNGLNGPRTKIYPINSQEGRKAINSCGRLKKGYTFNKGGRTINYHGLNGASAIEAQNSLAQLCALLKELRAAGVPRQITDTILARIKEYLSNGIDPEVAISGQGMVIEGELFRFEQPGKKIREVEFFVERKQQGLGNFNFNELLDGAMNTLEKEGNTWLQTIFSNLKIDLCGLLGSSATKKTAEDFVNKKVTPWAKLRLQALSNIPGSSDGQITTGINAFMKDLATIKAHQLFHKSESKQECGRKANQSMADFITAIENMMGPVFAQMSSDYTITAQTISYSANQSSVAGIAENWKGKTVGAAFVSRTFKIKPGATGGVPIVTIPTAGGSKPGSGTTLPPVNTTPVTKPNTGTISANTGPTTLLPVPQANKASMNWILILALAGGAWMYGTGKFGNDTNTQKAK